VVRGDEESVDFPESSSAYAEEESERANEVGNTTRMSDDSPSTVADTHMHAATVGSLSDPEEVVPATQAAFAGRGTFGVQELTVEEELHLLKQENAKLREEIQNLRAAEEKPYSLKQENIKLREEIRILRTGAVVRESEHNV